MLNCSREGLFELGRQLQQEGDSQAALHCFLSCLLGLTQVQSFHSLPNCLHQIAELYIDEKNYGKALQFIQAEKMFYEVALIELTSLHRSTGCQEDKSLGTSECLSHEELSEQTSQAQDLERLAQLCIMSKSANQGVGVTTAKGRDGNRRELKGPHLALEYSGKATKIHQRAFGNNHPITARSLELLATVYAEIGKTEYTDSLGECVSTLSKRFSATESFSDALSDNSHSHRDKHTELWHRKEPYIHQETLKTNVISKKLPTSILKRSNVSSVESDSSRRRKTERRVRFREPEITVHVYDKPQSHLHLALLSCLFLLLSALGLALYCTDRRRPQRACEELQTALAVYLLQFKQIIWACWIWLTMQ
ncbi:nutritionally-regulated adipose and cardiac enriched protein homolog isoform X2 [Xyrauchen texanus]|uniref:nutritionally-regulated adipose and cardiac enriched protein homolog isoform X2 n=1 Tax=Xyrauchen texanus TaxID=154827 RepID=UPI002242745D|nr:nutritionally-regulated adipose and cardiac enriched protein homolog isoform X2 [Xyrauchen texanus]